MKNNFFKEPQLYKPKKIFLTYFIEKFWFIPSDVLQRGMEANIWNLCSFKHPILEIGIGNGALTKLLYKNLSYIDTGIDIESGGFMQAKNTHIYKNVFEANAEHMPFRNNTFRTVIANSTFEHINHDTQAITEVARTLKKDGLFFINVPSNYLEEWILAYEKEKDNINAKKILTAFNNRAEHRHYHSLTQWKKILSDNNLELIFSKYYLKHKETIFWYRMFSFFTQKIGRREIWSWIGDSRITPFLPKKMLQKTVALFLKNHYINAYITTDTEGGQLFIVAKKNK